MILPALIKLDIIDLNKRLRERYKKRKSNLLDLLPDDVLRIIVKHKVNYDFDDEYDYDFVKSKYNRLYTSFSLNSISFKIIQDNNWKFIFKDPKPYEDGNYDYRKRASEIDFVKQKLIDSNNNFDYLKYFKRYLKKIIEKKFIVGNTINRSFKNKTTKEVITIPFTILRREDDYMIAEIEGTNIEVYLNINFEENIKEDEENIYLKEYANFTMNKDLEKYLKEKNLKVIRYLINV